MNDIEFMRRALELAKKGTSETEPNPRVGCVLVKNGEVIGEGFHKKAGEAHAEVNAIECAEKKGFSAEGAVCYVSLEPCAHYGKTPPCAKLLVEKKVSRVVAAMEDPNPKVSGKGFEILEKSEIKTECGLLREEAKFLNRTFFHSLMHDTPYIFLKAGISIDGKIQTKIGESKWITSEASREEAHKFRSQVGAIAVGIGTVLSDNPLLSSRSLETENIDPLAVVFDSHLKIPENAKLLHRNSKAPTIIFTAKPDLKKLKVISKFENVEVITANDNGKVSIIEALKILRKRNIISLMVEGGGTLAYGFMRLGLIDEIMIYLSPILIGGNAKSFISGEGISHLSEAKHYVLNEIRKGEDLFLRYLRGEEYVY